MRKLVALAAALVATLAFAPPVFAQGIVECQYSSEEVVGSDDCTAAQVQQALEAAVAAANAASAASDSASAAAGGAVDGEVAFRAALDAARDTGLNEETARSVATQAVASVSTGPRTEAKKTKTVEKPKPRSEEASGRASDEDTDRDEIKVLPATGGTLSEVAFVPGVMALLVGAGLLVRRLVR
jgi:membrane-bound lytic murein transglycosylase B